MGARAKITVVGAGNVGATAAQYIVEKELGDVVLVEQIIEITLTAEEQAAFDKSAAAVRELVEKLKLS